jgi:hypothetical protein
MRLQGTLRALGCVCLSLLAGYGCSDNTSNPDKGTVDRLVSDRQIADHGNDGGGNDTVSACAKNPTTHLEIINACSSAQSYDKTPFYPTLAPGGVLPALP